MASGPAHVLVLGGQRSGKSRYAEQLIADGKRRALYLATATAGDGEMAARIATHRARRGSAWETIEEPLDLARAIATNAKPDVVVLVECLTLWLSNLYGAGRSPDEEVDRLVGALDGARGPVVLVSNEVGAGIIPDNPLARTYADALGTLNQRIAAAVTRVVLVAAGIPILIKPAPAPEVIL